MIQPTDYQFLFTMARPTQLSTSLCTTQGGYHLYLQYPTSLIRSEGIDPEDSGAHSISKGLHTTCAPSITAVCNRAGWTMGKVTLARD